MLNGLPALPLYVLAVPPSNAPLTRRSNSLQIPGVTNDPRPLSEVPTASSVYSQTSPEMTHVFPNSKHPPRSSSLYPDDVSPPESLHTKDNDMGAHGQDSPDVSPISDTASPSASGRSPTTSLGRFNSNLPVPKKTRKFWNRPSIGSTEQGISTTHWDVYSGEPTTSERGKPPSTTPSAVKLHADPSPGRLNGYGTSTHITGGSPKEGHSIGRKRVASRDMNHASIIRPEWKGAGGRQKIVNPLLDKPLPPGKAATYPAGTEAHHQEEARMRQIAEERARSPGTPTSTNAVSRGAQTTNQDPQQNLFLPNETQESSLPRAATPSLQHPDRQPSESSLYPSDTRSPLERNPSTEAIQDPRAQPLPEVPETPKQADFVSRWKGAEEPSEPEMTARNNGEHNTNEIESRFRADLQNMHLQNEPKSRFSATTCATTTNGSPPTTPEIDNHSPAMSATPNSILNRKRPVQPAGILSSKVTRKPTPSEMSAVSSTPSESRQKSLPKSPPEKQAVSRVAGLQAKVDNLKRRKANLQTVIYELTHVVQPSSIAYDMATRQEIKRTVEGLNQELAEVQKDEHETGLKLHRAMKRDDEFAAYEPTSIWVRRVTS